MDTLNELIGIVENKDPGEEVTKLVVQETPINIVPTRQQIQDKIKAISEDKTYSTIKSDMYQRISTWLDEIGCIDPDKEKILDDLVSYEGY